jgi:hypothetical protein
MVVLSHSSHCLRSLSSLSRVDLYQPGVVLTTICAATALLATIFFIVTLVWPKNATGSLKIQAWIFTFFSVWLVATQIPYTVVVANRNAKVDAFLAGTQLPAQAVQAALAAAGESTKYSKLHFGMSTSCRIGRFKNHGHGADFPPQLSFLPFSLGFRCSLLSALYSFSLRPPEDTNSRRWNQLLSRPFLMEKRANHEHES